METNEDSFLPGNEHTPEIVPTMHHKRWIRNALLYILTLLIGSTIFISYISASPSQVAKNIIVDIPSGSSVRSIGAMLERAEIIRSKEIFIVLARVKNIETTLPSGIFQFAMPMNVFAIINQMSTNTRGISEVKVTIPEGISNTQMAEIFSKNFPSITRDEFVIASKGSEGYLFPDTYFFYINATTGPVISSLLDNFSTRTKGLRIEADAQKKNWSDIVILASLIEEEAATKEDKKIISGILWGRLERGMRLQLDASFAYLMGKQSSDLTLDDLALDSPYNTYRYKGLPPTPISNPGLESLDAALHPTLTDYVYYLSDKEGVMHYARTFEEHKFNKAKYLR